MKYVLLVSLLGFSCAHRVPEGISRPVPRPSFSADELMSVCWPEDAASTERVRLSFERSGGVLQQVFFEALDGASNSTARCMRQVAVSFPWGWNEVPERLELTPSVVPPSGWVILAFHQLVSHGLPESSMGIENPSELVATCLGNGSVRPRLRFKVQPAPVRISLWMLDGETWKETSALLPAERCVSAVLSSTSFNIRGHTLDFSQSDSRVRSRSKESVSLYFPKTASSRKLIEAVELTRVMQAIRPKVESCWNKTLERRWGLGGGRTFRWNVNEKGVVEHVWVEENLTDAGVDVVDYLFDLCLTKVLTETSYPVTSNPSEGLYSWVFAAR